MADKAVDFEPQDLFNLGGSFVAKASSTTTDQETTVERKSSDGKTIAEFCQFGGMTRYSATYEYGGADLVTDFVAKLAQIVNSIAIDTIRLTLGAQAIVQIQIDGHNHDSNAHAAPAPASGLFDGYNLALSGLIGAAQGSCGINDGDKPFSNSDGDSDLVSLTINFTCNHVDEFGSDGEHFAGDWFAGKVEVNAEYVGAPTLTTTGWTVRPQETAEGSEQADKFTITAEKALAVTTA